MSLSTDCNEHLEARVLDALRAVRAADGSDVLSRGDVYAVVATDGAVRVLLDPAHIDESAQAALAEVLDGYLQTVPGVDRVVVKARPRAPASARRLPGIERVYAVHSGKGGVGKSTVSVNLALALAALGQRVGLLDADVYGPSCPLLLGAAGRAESTADGRRIRPVAAHGISVMSLDFLMPRGQALAWRGSLVDQGMGQLFDDVDWGRLDTLIIDMPPGTSDVHLAAAARVRIDGVVTVTAPGQVSVEDVRRGMEMYADLAIPILGLVENFARFVCPDCGGQSALFGQGGGASLAAATGLPMLASIPFDTDLARAGETGQPVVVADVESAAAATYLDLARHLAATGSGTRPTEH